MHKHIHVCGIVYIDIGRVMHSIRHINIGGVVHRIGNIHVCGIVYIDIGGVVYVNVGSIMHNSRVIHSVSEGIRMNQNDGIMNYNCIIKRIINKNCG